MKLSARSTKSPVAKRRMTVWQSHALATARCKTRRASGGNSLALPPIASGSGASRLPARAACRCEAHTACVAASS